MKKMMECFTKCFCIREIEIVSYLFKSAVLGNNVNVVKKIHHLMKDEVDLNNQEIESDGETLIIICISSDQI